MPGLVENKKRKTFDGHDDALLDSDNINRKLRDELAETKQQLAEAQELIEKLQSTNDIEDNDVSDEESELDANDKWNSKFLMLRAFRIREGHCRVPLSDKTIGQWVNNQKRAYKNVKTGKKGTKITKERIDMLDSLGIVWGKDFPVPLSWDQGMEELKKFHKAMGHANIPINDNNHTPIAKWIRAQRAEWKRFLLGKDSLINLEHIAQFQEIGFRRKLC